MVELIKNGLGDRKTFSGLPFKLLLSESGRIGIINELQWRQVE
jgi:hypothetical protein